MQHPWNHSFGGFLSPFFPKYDTTLLKFRPEVVSHKTKTVFKKPFKIKCLSRNGTYPKLKVFVNFGAQFNPGKPKIDNTSTRFQINHRILIKLIEKNHFWSKNGLFKIKNRPVNKNQEVRGQVRTTFSEAPNSGLTIGQRIFVVPWLKLVLFKFWSRFISFLPPFLTVG